MRNAIALQAFNIFSRRFRLYDDIIMMRFLMMAVLIAFTLLSHLIIMILGFRAGGLKSVFDDGC